MNSSDGDGDGDEAEREAAVVVLLSVMGPTTLIEDGETLPAVGQTAVFALGFSEPEATSP